VITTEDQELVISVVTLLGNDSDPNAGDVLNVIGVDTSQTIGTLTDTGGGSYVYDPVGLFDYLAEGEQATDKGGSGDYRYGRE